MLGESIVERVVRATNHLRAALLSGFTTYRDLGSEGMQTFDANLRDCVNRGLTPGPRLFVATHALASTGSYDIRTENAANGMCGPQISDACDGAVGVRKAVRRRVAEGADVIKFYADYRRKIMRFPPAQPHPYIGSVLYPPSDPNPTVTMFNQEEMDSIVAEAKLARMPVACHAGSNEAALMATRAGVTSIEHAPMASEKLLHEMQEQGTIYVPTLAAMELFGGADFDAILGRTKKAFEIGVRLAVGGDTGTFPHGQGVREIELMIKAGVPLEDALEACMVGGWEACGKDDCGYRFGWFEKGCRADIIALETDPRIDENALRKVTFVMKDARIWKKHGVPCSSLAEPFGMPESISQTSHLGEDSTWEII
jgi:imidazolonepropionase-like amidohydrolase